MPETAMRLGGFIRWLLKGCKTNLKDEVQGNLEATWGGSYDCENYIIGIITAAILIGVFSWIAFG